MYFIFICIFFRNFFYINYISASSFSVDQLFGGKLIKNVSKSIMSTTIELKGEENIIKNEKYFIAASHH